MGPPESAPDAELIRLVAAEVGLSLEREAVAQLARFAELFLTWNARINLGGAISPRELVERHFLDGFVAARHVPAGRRICDVGSGGGLPAFPLAMARADCAITLFEPTGKKVAFLRTAARELGLAERVTVQAGRVSISSGGLVQLPGGDEAAFDVAMSRATLAPRDWLRLGQALVKPEGRVIVFATSPTLREVEPPEETDGYAPGRWLLVFGRGEGALQRST